MHVAQVTVVEDVMIVEEGDLLARDFAIEGAPVI